MIKTSAYQRGYSILEALIATAILASLATVMTPALMTSLQSSGKTINQSENRETLRTVEDALSVIFGGVVLLEQGNDRLQFQGRPKEMTFVSLAGAQNFPRSFRLTIRDGALSAEISALTNETERHTVVIATHEAVSFEYFGVREGTQNPSWTPNWNNPRPPSLVRVEFHGAAAKTAYSIDTYIAAQAPLHCPFDPVSRQCRV